jgi:hypothetical protein
MKMPFALCPLSPLGRSFGHGLWSEEFGQVTSIGIGFDKTGTRQTIGAENNVACRSVARVQNDCHQKNNQNKNLMR